MAISFEFEIPEKTSIFEVNSPTEIVPELNRYFETLQLDEIEDFDLAIIPVISLYSGKVDRIEKGFYSSDGNNEEEEKKNTSIYRAIKGELIDLFCGSNGKYEKLKKNFNNNFDHAITLIAVYIAGSTGLEIGMVTAVVSICVKTIAEMGVNVWCSVIG